MRALLDALLYGVYWAGSDTYAQYTYQFQGAREVHNFVERGIFGTNPTYVYVHSFE